MRILGRRINPVTIKRMQRFREMKRAWWSLLLLAMAYLISLGAELVCNDKPLYLHFEDESYFPVFRFYPDDAFTGSGNQTRPDYKEIVDSERFRNGEGNRVLWPIHPYGPDEILSPEDIDVADEVRVRIEPEPHAARVNLTPELELARARDTGFFFPEEQGPLDAVYVVPARLREAIEKRFANEPSERFESVVTAREDVDGVPRRMEVSLSTYRTRSRPPRTVRVTLRELVDAAASATTLVFDTDGDTRSRAAVWSAASNAERETLREKAHLRLSEPVETTSMMLGGEQYRVSFDKTDVRWPFPPVEGHPLGIDEAGRDVLAWIIYGCRTSMSFGLLLVLLSMTIGVVIGGVQGYFAGWFDISCQRLIEIWSALPFLYVMILMGQVYGRGFVLLLCIYAAFNWIGISYYMRAEFLRLRRQQFVEAARCLGVPTWKILFKHIFPNALVPVITFFPFSLVGAIGALAALDYLGFGMPANTASWGELLRQAQVFSWAWWLIVFPGAALFIVMLLGVFVGEGVRNAWDPRDYAGIQ